ncbi:MAG: hypothetical protein JRM89_06330 [Nitrososphaerota archaeon]|jgi:hypothetical protein|nr:hypothetical protein [Nitrososphaerota archaeon]
MMPKRLRYPLFLAGLAILVLGSLFENAEKASVSTYEATAIVGFALLVASVVMK